MDDGERLFFNEKRGEGKVAMNEKWLDYKRQKKEERVC